MIVVLGTQAGCLASTVNPFATVSPAWCRGHLGRRRHGHARADAGVFTGLVIFIINRYADKVKAHPREVGPVLPSQASILSVPVSADENWSCPAVRRACWPSSSSRSPSWWGACRGLINPD